MVYSCGADLPLLSRCTVPGVEVVSGEVSWLNRRAGRRRAGTRWVQVCPRVACRDSMHERPLFSPCLVQTVETASRLSPW